MDEPRLTAEKCFDDNERLALDMAKMVVNVLGSRDTMVRRERLVIARSLAESLRVLLLV